MKSARHTWLPTSMLSRALLLGLAGLCAPVRAQAPSEPVAAAAAPWQGVWHGRVGAQGVVMALYPDDASPHSGRYFYERFGRDISLWRLPPDSGSPGIHLLECPPDYGSTFEPCAQPTGTWVLALTAGASPRLQGQWRPAGLAGRRAPPSQWVELIRVADYTPAAEAFKDPYEQARQRGIQAQRQAGGQRGSLIWHTMVDKRSGVTVPQFTAGAGADALARINRTLKDRWKERIGEALSAVDHDDALNVAFANPRWLALTYSFGFYYAGAAHPSSGFAVTTYDLRNGRPVDWSQWFRFTAPGPEPLSLTRRDLLAAQVLRRMSNQLAADPSPSNPEDASCIQRVLEHHGCARGYCTDGQLAQGHVPDNWLIWPTDQGLAVSVDIYSESERPCRGEHVVLPWPQARAALLRPQALP